MQIVCGVCHDSLPCCKCAIHPACKFSQGKGLLGFCLSKEKRHRSPDIHIISRFSRNCKKALLRTDANKMDSWEERTDGQAGASQQQHQQQHQQQRPGMLRLNPTAPTFNFNPGASTFAPSWGPPPPAFAAPPAYGAPQFPAATPAPPARPPATYGEPPAAARPPPFVLSDEERRSLQAAAASSSNSGTHLPFFVLR